MSINRRELMTVTAAAAAAAATASSAMGAEAVAATAKPSKGGVHGKSLNRIVTLEEHFISRPLLDASPKLLERTHLMPAWLKDKLGDLGSERLRDMDEYGITVQVISATVPGADLLDGQEGINFARGTNDQLAAQVKRYPNRYAGFAHLPMRSPEAAADELERAVTRLGFCGALINGMTEDRFLDHPRFAPVLARAVALDVPIYIHPNVPPKAVFDLYYAGLPQVQQYLLAWAGFGWHAEVGIHLLRLVLAGCFEKHRGLKIIIGHMGEILPFMLDRIDHAAADLVPFPIDFDGKISEVIVNNVYLTTSGTFSTPAFLCALTKFGADRIMFSVDYPYSRISLGRKWLDTIPVSSADKLKIMHGNADRLLKLTPAT